MHELPLTKSIFKTVVAKAESVDAASITKVVLEIGILRDFIPEIVQKYWDYISSGSLAEGSKIIINELPASARCSQCGSIYRIKKSNLSESQCPNCSNPYGTLVSGDELRIAGIEIKKKK